MPVVGDVTSTGKNVIDLFAGDETSLEDLRQKISSLFESLNRRVVIVLDDIDRLTQEEIRQTFKLIKVNANFPKTIYLVEFDREVVEAALTSEQGIIGRKYLEKIVQVGYDVPTIDAAYISKILETQLQPFRPVLGSRFYDPTRWEDLCQTGMRPLFTNLRDVKRFINGLAFNNKIVQGEVNPIDLVALEALRTFVPTVYSSISQNKALFTDYNLAFMPSQTERTAAVVTFDAIFTSPTPDARIGVAKNICERLFPQMSSAYQTNPYNYVEQERNWRTTRRICHPGVFDVYFVLGTPVGDVSVSEAQQLAHMSNEPDQIASAMDAFKKDGRLARLLVLFEDMCSELTDPQARGLCLALLRMSGSIDDRFIDRQVSDLIYSLLRRFSDADRCQWFASQIQAIDDISTIIAVLINCEDKNGQLATNAPFDAACFEELKQHTCEAIRLLAASGVLLTKKRFIGVIATWRKWSGEETHFTEYIQGVLHKPLDFSVSISGFLQQPDYPTSTPGSEEPSLQLDLPKLKVYANPQQLREALALVTDQDRQTMSERQRMALQQLAEALAVSGHPEQEDTQSSE